MAHHFILLPLNSFDLRLIGRECVLRTLCHSCGLRVYLSPEGAKNVSWSWLSPLRVWGILIMVFTSKFIYIYTHEHTCTYIQINMYIAMYTCVYTQSHIYILSGIQWGFSLLVLQCCNIITLVLIQMTARKRKKLQAIFLFVEISYNNRKYHQTFS